MLEGLARETAAAIILGDDPLPAAVLDAVVSSPRLELGQAKVGQLTLVVDDPGWTLLSAGIFLTGTPMAADGETLEVAAVATGDERLVVMARTAAMCALARRRGGHVRRNVSPTEWARLEVVSTGAGFVGEPTPVWGGVARPGGERPWDSRSALARLAEEMGFWFMEAANTVYFASPAWLQGLPALAPVGWGGSAGVERDAARLPRFRRSVDDAYSARGWIQPAHGSPAAAAKPGAVLEVSGIPTFEGTYVVAELERVLDGQAGPEITVVSTAGREPGWTDPSRPLRRPASVDGVWRGKVTRLSGGRPLVEVPRLAPGYEFGPLEALPGVILAAGDRVLVGLVEGRLDDLVLVRRL